MTRNVRFRHKEWKNGKYPNWTCRIIWYEAANQQSIRLHLEDSTGVRNVYPTSVQQADIMWEEFKTAALDAGRNYTSFVNELIKEVFGEKEKHEKDT